MGQLFNESQRWAEIKGRIQAHIDKQHGCTEAERTLLFLSLIQQAASTALLRAKQAHISRNPRELRNALQDYSASMFGAKESNLNFVTPPDIAYLLKTLIEWET